jgi:CubicO group peptidase (beta-lactamase class C family)
MQYTMPLRFRLTILLFISVILIRCSSEEEIVPADSDNPTSFPIALNNNMPRLIDRNQTTASLAVGVNQGADCYFVAQIDSLSDPTPIQVTNGLNASDNTAAISGFVSLDSGINVTIDIQGLMPYSDYRVFFFIHNQTDTLTTNIELVNPVSELTSRASGLDYLHSVLVSRNGELIYEEYFNNRTVQTLEDGRSVSKGITALVVGKAIELGYFNLNSTIEDFFPEKYLTDIEDKKKNITVEQLLTMSSGLGYNEPEYSQWIQEPDEIEVILNRPLQSEPGKVFNYSTPNLQMLSVIFQEATGQDLLEFGNENIFHPLGIDSIIWPKFETGYVIAGSAFRTRPRDYLKIGEMVLNKGVFSEQSIINSQYLDEMHAPKFTFSNYLTTGSKVESNWFGYLWWDLDAGSLDGYMTSGYGGQNIIIFPNEEVVVITNARWQVNGATAVNQQIEIWSLIADLVNEILEVEIP